MIRVRERELPWGDQRVDANLAALRARFESDPSDAVAFEALEEAYFVAGRWPELVAHYEHRLTAPELSAERNGRARARLILRLAQVLEERCLQPDLALERYQETLRLDPTLRPALVQLRSLHASRGQWDLVIQVAELEAGLPMRPFEEASFLTEMGDVWLRHLGDAEQALLHFERSLAISPEHGPGWLGKAEAHEAMGQPAEAARALERVIALAQGVERASARVKLARLANGPLGDAPRAAELFDEALRDDPRNEPALEAAADRAEREERFDVFDQLQERRFDLATGAVRRLAIAHEAGRVQLERVRDPHTARHWFQRALDLFPDDPMVHLYLADVERLSGNSSALSLHLRRAAELAEDAAPLDVLRESAELASEEGDHQRAAENLRKVLQRDPNQPELLADLADALHRAGRDEELVAVLEDQVGHTPDRSPERLAALLLLGAAHEEHLGDPDAALEAYERAATIDPGAPEVSRRIERLHRKAERWEALRDHLMRTLQATGEQVTAAGPLLCSLGELLVQPLGQLEEARDRFQAALALDPESVRARQGLERVALALGDDEALLDAFEREATVTTDRSRLAFLVGEMARIFEERGDLERAVHWAERLVDVMPESLEALERCARLQEALGRSNALIATLCRMDVLLDGAEQGRLRRRLTTLHRVAGDSDAALHWARASLEVEPDAVEALDVLCQILAERDLPQEEALARRRLAVQLAGVDNAALAKCLQELARLLEERLDDPSGAVAALEEAVGLPEAPPEVGPRLEDLLHRLGRYEALALRLATRRETLPDDAPEAAELDLERALLQVEQLDCPEKAIPLLESARHRHPQPERVVEVLERALRRSGDAERLVALLGERSHAEPDAARRACIDLERAHWLEAALERPRDARQLLLDVADGETPMAAEAERRLEQLLERSADWPSLLRRLQHRGEGAPDSERAELLVQQATVCRDRLQDPDAATQHLEEAGRFAPQRAEIWQNLARLHSDADRPLDLLRVLCAELDTAPERDRALTLHASAADLCHAHQGDPAGAEAHYLACLEIDPAFPPALAYLAERFEAESRHAELAALLGRQLTLTPEESSASTSLRLRLAALQSEPLGDLEAAIATLEPIAVRDDTLAIAAEPLADLYQRTGRIPDLVALCRRAAQAAEASGEQAAWQIRLGDSLAGSGDAAGAADAYRRALASRPGDRDVEAQLRDLYRQLGEAESLCRLLDAELGHVGGRDEVPLRLELARLLNERLGRPADALLHLHRVLEIHPEHPVALQQALAAARECAPPAEHASLLESAIRCEDVPVVRARLLTERAALLECELSQPDQARDCLHEAVAADPTAGAPRAALRRLLETAGDWPGVLACSEGELAHGAATARRRGEILEEAAEIALAEVPGEALAWLERLRAMRPRDAQILQRIAEVQRRDDRPTLLLATLEAEIALEPDADRRVALGLECAALLEQRLDAPGRALAALEGAQRAAPDNDAVLGELERLYAAGRRADLQARVIEQRIALHQGAMRLSLRRKAADAHANAGDLPACASQLWHALAEPACAGADRAELLGELGDVLGRLGREDLRARVAEQELRELDPAAPVFSERRRALHQGLAHVYRERLGRRSEAAQHARALLDGGLIQPEGPTAQRYDEEERALLDLLRAAQDAAELEMRLTRRLQRLQGSADSSAEAWLELGRLRLERLHRPAAAAAAFRQVLGRDTRNLDALRGLRQAAARLGDAATLAETLEREIALREGASSHERGALLRRLGEVAWKSLDETPRASRAFAAALEADPRDRVALRSLEKLYETMEDWRAALDLYECEVEVLGEQDPTRRQAAWLRAAEIACAHTHEPERALHAYEAASEVARLPTERRLEWAKLYRQLGQTERFVEVFASVVDDGASEATASDLLALAASLEELARPSEALQRVRQALVKCPETTRAWDAAARLELALAKPDGAAAALEESARRCSGRAAAERRLLAAALVQARDACLAERLLQEASQDDPALALAHARLACVASAQDHAEKSQAAAERALELAAGLPPEERLTSDLAGARAARQLQQLDAAARLYADALDIAPEHTDALEAQGEVLAALGDWQAARAALEQRVNLAGAPPPAPLHHTLLGTALEESCEDDEALAHYAAALAADPCFEAAHERRAALLERMGRGRDAVDALQTWAARSAEPARVGALLLRAAEMELADEGREEPAEGLLCEAIAAAPQIQHAWALLCQLVWDRGADKEAEALASRALETDLSGSDRACVCHVRAQALEKAGDRSEAAQAYAATCSADPERGDAALSGARLLRGLGDWRAAADLLRRFLEGPGVDRRGDAWHQLGRLLAGPLEDVRSAIQAYRQALAEDPELREAREALADLLVHTPEHWDEAVRFHRLLLAQQPLRLTSLRGLLCIAKGRQNTSAAATGLAILRSLGSATPEERIEAPARPSFNPGRRAGLADPVFETLRRVSQEASREIADALGSGVPEGDGAPSGDPVARFRAQVTAEEGALSAPALVPLETQDLAEILRLVVQMTLDSPSVQGNGDLVNALSRTLGRRARRRVRKVLGNLGPEVPAQVDFWSWRAELRGLASAVALAQGDADLRTAFLAWTHGDDPESIRATGPETDLRDAISGSPEALALLRQVTRSWIDALA